MLTKFKPLLVVVIALAAAGTTTSPASASPGWAQGQLVWCHNGLTDWRINVNSPTMYAVPLPRVRPDGTVIFGPTHYQWVSYRAMLYRWDGNRWVYQLSEPRMKTLVTDEPHYVHPYWINMETGQVVYGNGDTGFWIFRGGHYRVDLDIRWHADEYVGDSWALLAPAGYLWRSDDNFRARARTHCTF